MKKSIKIILSIICIILIIIIVDMICIFTINRPLLAIKNNNVYKGLFYDTYDCAEYAVPQIKLKGTKFTCANINFKKITNIIDKTKNIKDFACAEVLEQFYEDENYVYYFSCIKSEYIIVKYNDNTEDTVKKALENNVITISDLDKYNINYYKHKK